MGDGGFMDERYKDLGTFSTRAENHFWKGTKIWGTSKSRKRYRNLGVASVKKVTKD